MSYNGWSNYATFRVANDLLNSWQWGRQRNDKHRVS